MFHIRALQKQDIPGITRLRNQASGRFFTAAMPYTSVLQASDYFVNPPDTTHILVACDEANKVLGVADLDIHTHPRCAHGASLGIMVAQEARQQGVGRALMKALLDLADNWLNINRLDLKVYTNNEVAIRLYQQLGFEIEVTMPRYSMQDGVLVDCYVMARLRSGLPKDTTPAPPLPPQIPFTGEMKLRALEPDDAAAHAALRDQPLVRHFMLGLPYQPTPEKSRKWLETIKGEKRAIGAFADEQLVGITVVAPYLQRRRHSGGLDVLQVHDAFQGFGIGRKLMSAALDVADNWLGLTRLSLHVLADNERAIKLYQSFGFVPEGVLRAEIFRNGAYADTMVMGRLR